MPYRPAPLANPLRRNFCGFNAVAQALRALVAAHPSYAAALQRDAASVEHKRASLAKCLLDAKAPVAETVKRVFAPRFSNDVEYDAEEILDALLQTLTDFAVLFAGSLVATTTCRAMSHVTGCSQPFSRLQVKPGDVDTNLVEAMAATFAPEALVTDAKDFHRCGECIEAKIPLQGSTAATAVESAGEILAVHIARSRFAADGSRMTKNRAVVSFAESLTMAGSDYCLMAAVSHTGLSSRSGHYVAHTKNSSGEWHLCNDAEVTLMPRNFAPSSKIACDGYLLFYVVSAAALCFVLRLCINPPGPTPS
jgi:hypothetical protein